MTNVNNNIALESYIDETKENLSKIQSLLLDLELNSSNKEIINQLFRIFHTIKGTSLMLGFVEVSELTHEVENIFDRLRSNELAVNTEIVTKTLQVCDVIEALVTSNVTSRAELVLLNQLKNDFKIIAKLDKKVDNTTESISNVKNDFQNFSCNLIHSSVTDNNHTSNTNSKEHNKFISKTEFSDNHIVSDIEHENTTNTSSSSNHCNESNENNKYIIYFEPHPNVFINGNNLFGIFKELSQIGAIKAFPITKKIPILNQFNPELCYLAWNIEITTKEDINTIKDVFIFLENESKIEILFYKDATIKDNSSSNSFTNLQVDNNSYISSKEKTVGISQTANSEEAISYKQSKTENNTNISSIYPPTTISNNLISNKLSPEIVNLLINFSNKIVTQFSYLEKLNKLTQHVSELVSFQSQLNQATLFSNNSNLHSIVEEFERIVNQLKDSTTKIKMIPINPHLENLKGLLDLISFLRSLIPTSNNSTLPNINIILESEDFEINLDLYKIIIPVVSQIISKMLSLVYICADIESNKDNSFEIVLKYSQSSNNFLFSIKFKNFLNLNIFEKIEKNTILLQAFLKFLDDVVKLKDITLQNIPMELAAINGKLELKIIEKDINFYITAPLFSAIIDGLLLKVEQTNLIIPLTYVEECVEFNKLFIVSDNLVKIRDKLVPFISLRDKLNIRSRLPAIQQMVITIFENTRLGLVTDQIVGEVQAIVKPISKICKNICISSSAAILADGNIAFILDPSNLK